MLYTIDLLAAALIAGRAIYVLNKMDFRTRHTIGCAYLFMAIGGFATFMGLLLGHLHPEWQRTMIDCALATLILFNKRRTTPETPKVERGEVTRVFQDDHDHTLVNRG
jgi:hypothetical protein